MKNKGFIKLYRDMLSQQEVANMVYEEGAAGLGLYILINLYLAHCEGGWGVYTGRQLSSLAVQVKKHRSDVDRVICNYDLFVTDGTRFTSHWIQQQYAVATGKMLHSRANLLLRAEEIEEYKDIKKEKQKKCVRHDGTHSEFETLRAGRRYASHGQPLPGDAPPQRRRNDMYSYLRHEWVPAEEFDKEAEMKVYRQLFNTDEV